MKKTLLLAFAVFLCTANAKAENRVEKFGVFDHVSIGITAFDILNGWGFEAAAPITDFVQFRAGYVFLPKFHYTTDFEYNKNDGTTGDVPVKFQLNKGDAKLLFDVFPIRKSSFHLTVGAFIGKNKFLTAETTRALDDVKPGEGLIVGDYTLGADASGIIRASIKSKTFKPYVGIGFGRPVPKKRVSCCFDMGVLFWGSPAVYGYDVDDHSEHKITSTDTGEETAKYFDILGKIKIYPSISLRINGRIF